MVIDKNLNLIILLGIFSLNILAMTPFLQDDNGESAEFFPALLRGFGLRSQKSVTNHHLSRLLSSSPANQLHSDKIHFAKSAYFVPGWADTRWQYRKNITIDHNKVDTALTNFPVFIELYDSDLRQNAQASGNDIMFTNASGHLLSHEIEVYDRVYNSSHAHLVAWVKTNLSSIQNTIISMYYGNPSAINQENPEEVWDNNYEFVLHMNQDPSSSNILDSTTNGYDFSVEASGSMTSDDLLDSKIGKAISFDGTDDYIYLPLSENFNGPTDKMTFEFWIMLPNGWSGGSSRFLASTANTQEDPYLWFYDEFDFHIETSSGGDTLSSTQTIFTAGNWYHFSCVWETNSIQRIYIGGSLDGEASTPHDGTHVTWNTFSIGAEDDNADGPGGSSPDKELFVTIGEFRLSSTVRSADWIASEFENQNNPNNFYQITSEEKYLDTVDWHYPGLKYRKEIIIDSTKVSGSSLSNFPVLIDLMDIDLHYPHNVQPDADDILFCDATGTKLDHEIELFDQVGNGTHAHLVAWVRIPTLSGTIDKQIFMYFGNSGMSSQANPTGVWNSNFKGVWHLNQNPAGTPPQIIDSTSNGNDGTTSDLSSGDLITGKVDGGLDFPDVGLPYINMGDQASLNMGSGDLTLELWFNYDAADSNAGPLAGKGAYGSGGKRYFIALTSGSGNIKAEIDDDITKHEITSTSTYGDSVWHHAVMVRDGNWLRFYIDGSEISGSPKNITGEGSLDNAGMPFTINTLSSDQGPTFSDDATIKMDEVRVSNTARSADWINTEYNNQDDPTGFYSIGSYEIRGNWSLPYLRYKKEITIDSSQVSGNLYNFPFLIDLYDTDLNKTDKVQSDGDDIAFTAANGARLDHEIELFDQNGNGTHAHLIAWVKIPILSATTDTVITMWYGNSAVGSLANAGAVWEDYGGVWHLDDDFLDSTSNDNDGTNYQSTDITAQIVDGQDFDGNDDYITTGSGSSLDNIFNDGATISVWVHPEGWGGASYGRILDKSAATSGTNGWVLCLDGVTGSPPPPVWTDQLLFYRDFSDNRGLWMTGDYSISLDQWQYVVVIYDDSSVSNDPVIYINGVLQTVTEDVGETPSGTANSDAAQSLYFGNFMGGGRGFDGGIDEVRLSYETRSANWVQTEYNNQLNPASFISVGNEIQRQLFDTSFTFNKDIILNNSQITGELSDFPILLDITDTGLKSGTVQPDAADILFIDPIGNKLDHEIESFTQTGSNGHLVVWVRIPHVFSEEKTTITLYYGNSELSNQENPTGLWNSIYRGVWHLNENPYDTAPQFHDSTSNSNDGTTGGSAGTLTQMTGQISGGILFPETDQDNVIDLSDDPTLRFSSDFWVSVWVKTNDSDSGVDVVLAKWGATAPNQNYFLGKLGASNTFELIIDSSQNVAIDISKINDGSWHYVVGVADSSANQLRLYVDGVLEGTSSYDGSSATDTTPLYLGRNPGAGVDQAWTGGMDECKVSNIIRSEDWIDTEYNNQFNPISFYMIAQEFSLDINPPVINDFSVEDLGTGIGKFWADITDTASDIDTVMMEINGTEYSMSFNGTYWIYQTSVQFNGYYEFQITNATDVRGNFITKPSSTKQTTFTKDLVSPDVIHWKYIQSTNTFKANVTDSWGEIHTVIVNVTYMGGQSRNNITAVMQNYQNFTGNLLGYHNDTLMMDNGEINFKIFVNDTAGNSFTSTEHQGNVFINHPPVAQNLNLNTPPYYSNTSLILTYDYSDEDSHAEAGTEIRWYKNSVLQTNYNDTDTIPASELFKGDDWYTTVKPKDGQLFGDLVTSSTVTIVNTPPKVQTLTLSPSVAYTTSTLQITNTTTDYENDPILTYYTEWYCNSIHNSLYDNLYSLSPDKIAKGETWYCKLRAFDGTDNSSWVTSNSIFIQNSLPSAVNLSLTSNPTTTDVLIADWDMQDNDVEDTENKAAAIVYWYNDGQLQSHLTNLTVVNPSNTSKNEWWHFVVQVYDGESYSSPTELLPHIKILNTPPVADNASIITSNPRTNDILQIDWDYVDVDNDPAGTPIIKWYLNNNYQSLYDGYDTLPASATTKGDSWHFGIQVYDGTSYSSQVNSSQVTIQNSPPEVENLGLTPNPVTTDDLVASWDSSDNDSGDSLTYTVVWFLNGIEQASLENETTIGAGNTTKGQLWSFTVQIHDDIDSSPLTSLGYNVTILNTAPIVGNLTLTASPTTTTDLIANFDSSDEDPGDSGSLVFIIQWFKNGQEISALANQTTIKSGNTSKTEFWWYTIKAHDGEANSSIAESPHVQILNSVPIIENLTITINPVTTNDLVADWDYFDADADSLSYTIRWYIVGQGLQSTYNNLDTVPSSATSKGETWYFNITAFDGSAYSTEEKSPETTILNSAPEVNNLAITANPTTIDDLVTSWDDADVDGDSLTFIISWYQDGSEQVALANTTIVGAGNTTKGEEWHFKVRAWDGETYSGLVSLVNNATILNSKPTATNPTFNNTDPADDDNFNITYTFSDADPGDFEDQGKVVVYWYVDWEYRPEFQNYTIIYGENTTADQVWYYKIRVYDGEDYCEGNVTSIQGITIQGIAPPNDPPQALELTLTPSAPKTHQSLVANYTYYDNNSDPEVTYEIRWYENTVLVPAYNNLFTVPFSATTKGDEWYFTVRVFDGQDWSLQNTSSTIIIDNTAPEADNLGLTSTPTTTDDLVASWVSSDNDTGDSLSYTVVWYLNGIEQASLENETTVGAGNTTKGQLWSFTVQIHDGTDSSPLTSLGYNVTILNTAPIVGNLTLTGNPTTTTDLIANFDSLDEDPADSGSLLFIIQWFRNGQEMSLLANETTIGSGNTSKNQVWWFKVQAHDGEASSTMLESDHIQILNTAPVVGNLTVTNPTPTTIDDLEATWDDLDVDGDSLNFIIRWFKNSVYQPTYDNQITIPSSETQKGDSWNYTLKAVDTSSAESDTKTLSTLITILNTAPVVANLTITSNPTTLTNLNSGWDTFDVDGDSLTYVLTWYLGGIEQPSLANESMIESGNTTKGDLWTFTVEIFDDVTSSQASLGYNVTITNSAPYAENLTLTSDVGTLDDLIADWDYSDDDNDPRNDILAHICWFKNGNNQTALTDQKYVNSTETTKNEVWWFTVRVHDGTTFSISLYESEHVQIQNTAPINTSSLPLPTNPTVETGLVLLESAILTSLNDADGDTIQFIASIRWFKASVIQSDLNGSLNVPDYRLTKGEIWHYTILPSDGLDEGSICVSSNILIQNSIPVVNLAYFAESDVTTIHNLTASFLYFDADGDSISVSGIRWHRSTDTSTPYTYNLVPIYSGNLSLPSTATNKNERWKFDIKITDGYNESISWIMSDYIEIQNSEPWIDPYSIELTGGENTSDPLLVNFSWFDNDPEDNLTGTTIVWENSGIYYDETTDTSLNASNTKAGERWWVTIKPYDGSSWGVSVNSKLYGISVIIGNSVPEIKQADIAIEGEFNGTEFSGGNYGTLFNLILRYNATDIDGDQGITAFGLNLADGYALGSEYRWYRNRSGTVTLITPLNNAITVPWYETREGDSWWVQVRPRDLYGDFGIPKNSTPIFIGNTAPQIRDYYWLELSYYTTNDLSFIYTFFDYDSDDVEQKLNIQWYKNGFHLPVLDNEAIIPSYNTTKGETWFVRIQVWDGEDYSDWYNLTTITILNSAPLANNVLLTPPSPYTTADLVPTWNFTDPDGDSENVTAAIIEWYKNGEYVGSFTNVSASLTNRGERWYFKISVYDGNNYSVYYQSNTITIMNSAPTVMSLLINNGNTSIYTTDTLEVTWEFYDIDLIDAQSSRSIIWYINGEIQSQFTNQSSIPARYVIKGQEWQVAVAVKDTGGLWSTTMFSSLVPISNSRPEITIYNASHPEFIVENELLEINPDWYLYTDADGDENILIIYWYVNSVYDAKFNNQTSIPVYETHPGEVWYYVIQPFDGIICGDNRTSAKISIESLPQINSIVVAPLTDVEGHYTIDVNTTDSRNNITQVEFVLTLNGTEELAPFVITSPISNGANIWRLDYVLSSYSYLDTSVSVVTTVITNVEGYSIDYEIRNSETNTFYLEDKAPPRVNEAWFVHDVNPTNITFYAEIEEYGSGISEIILYYSFIPANDTESPSLGGLGSNILQQEHQVQMTWHNETADSVLYQATIPFSPNGSNWKIFYRISTMDNNGNEDPYAFDILNFPERYDADIIYFTPLGMDPTLMIIIVGITIILAVMGSIVYVKFIRKPEIVGLDKELVLNKTTDISEAEVMAALDTHTIGVVVSFFDQRHGPIPIIVIPELLKDNFSKLVDLSDRSFSGTGFCDNFDAEITSSYDFVLTHGIRIKAMSFGYALERPQARGGQENITCNILVHQDLFPLINQFLDEIQIKVHTIHLLMDKDPSKKDKIRQKVIGLRKYVSAIVLSYEHIYGTTELVSEEN